MSKPKLDKARREWLAGLKTGDEVASISDYGPARIVNIERSRDKFREVSGRRNYLLSSAHSPSPKFGAQDGGARWLIPVTVEIRRAIRLHDWRSRIFRFGEWTNATDEQIEAIAKALEWDTDDGGSDNGR